MDDNDSIKLGVSVLGVYLVCFVWVMFKNILCVCAWTKEWNLYNKSIQYFYLFSSFNTQEIQKL
mgnify:CR=1 FL=1